MKAIRIHEFGPPAVIAREDRATPSAGEGEVLVRVMAAGVGPWDALIRSGKSVVSQPLPLTLGSDVSGVVDALGPGVTAFARGDEVFGLTNQRFTGGYAEYAVASAAMLARKPRGLSHVEAASIPVVAVTAWQMLFDDAGLTAGQTVLVQGAAGNVGAYAVQLAHRRGVRVIAGVTAKHVAEVHRLGADTIVDVGSARVDEVAKGVDAVIDTVGGDGQRALLATLKRGGILVSAVAEPDAEEAARRGVRAKFILVEVTTARLTKLAAMFEAGELTAHVGTVLPLADAARAHEMLDGARPRPGGKIVLDVAG